VKCQHLANDVFSHWSTSQHACVVSSSEIDMLHTCEFTIHSPGVILIKKRGPTIREISVMLIA